MRRCGIRSSPGVPDGSVPQSYGGLSLASGWHWSSLWEKRSREQYPKNSYLWQAIQSSSSTALEKRGGKRINGTTESMERIIILVPWDEKVEIYRDTFWRCSDRVFSVVVPILRNSLPMEIGTGPCGLTFPRAGRSNLFPSKKPLKDVFLPFNGVFAVLCVLQNFHPVIVLLPHYRVFPLWVRKGGAWIFEKPERRGKNNKILF